ncbi:hypothetical protein ACFQ48_19355 [Hymenobacter caeli]|uniref:DUF4369 domain-containing protein n=1 Tax=Hymenobacter caeli TaxID=2735894 RepID=A0ABX2FV27_9BACT|nr:hypothetical protein [Hymenobacter caeli]NRT21058.1 hypothetical protein [Hymenobacter caeli]
MKTFPLPSPSLPFVAARWGQWRTVLLLSALLGAFGPRAARAQQNTPLAGAYQTHDLTYRVWGCNPARLAGRVQVLGDNGAVLYEQRSSALSFGGLLNLSDLPDGRYALVVEIGREKHRFGVQLRTTEQRLAEVSGDQTPAAPRLLSAFRPAPTER